MAQLRSSHWGITNNISDENSGTTNNTMIILVTAVY